MAFFTLAEFIDLVIMTAALGFIFKDTFKRGQNPLEFATNRSFNWDDFWYACAVVAPSIILHEMAHKFVAMGFGLEATFHAALTWLGIGVLLKVMNFGFIFFVPGYVAISGAGTNLQFALVAVAGPLIHLLFWLGPKYYLDKARMIKKKRKRFWILTMQINKFLLILNMLPIPGFDGFSFYENLFQIFF